MELAANMLIVLTVQAGVFEACQCSETVSSWMPHQMLSCADAVLSLLC